MINSSIGTEILRSFTAYIETTPDMLVLKLRPALLKQFEDLDLTPEPSQPVEARRSYSHVFQFLTNRKPGPIRGTAMVALL